MSERIGILCGWENTFPPAFIERVNKESGVTAELAKIGGTNERFEKKYSVLIDRISQEVEHYRLHLKAAQLAGTYCINDPLWWSADDKFFGFSLAAKLGVATPKTVLLPQRDYIPAIDKQRSLRNLEFPLDWKAITDYIGFPAILKPAQGGGWKHVTKVNNLEELWAAYNKSDILPMTLQEFIDFDNYARCICIGREFILPIHYDPKLRGPIGMGRYLVEEEGWLGQGLHQRVVDDAWKLCNALGYDMNSVEFAIKDGVPYAIDFTNPAPDMDKWSITEHYFDIVVDQMAKFTVNVAKGKIAPPKRHMFQEWIDGGAHANDLGPASRGKAPEAPKSAAKKAKK
jgi:hypothetical protein